MSRQSFCVLLVSASLALASMPAAAQSSGNIFQDIFKPPAPVQQQPDPTTTAQSELMLRMDRLENTVRQLTGQIEQLQFRLQQAEQGAPRAAGAAGAPPPPTANRAPVAVPQSAPLAPPPGTAAAPGRRSDAFDPNAIPDAPGAPQPLGSPASSSAAGANPAGAPVDIGAPRGGQQVAGLPPGAGAKDMFDLGYGQIQRQDWPAAEQTFRQMLQTYPSDRLVPEATYFLGETLFYRQDYKDAAEQFLQVSTKYPNAPRAPEALLRLGQSLSAMNEREAACATLGEVDRKYPRAASSVRQAVEREQKRAGC